MVRTGSRSVICRPYPSRKVGQDHNLTVQDSAPEGKIRGLDWGKAMASKSTVGPVDLAHVFLDNFNPRHDPIDNEPEIIAHLLAREQVKPLARDIAQRGSLSPLERLALVPHSRVRGAFISLEGNRRVCALKLLADPEKAPSEAYKRYFRQQSARLRLKIKQVDAIIFGSREEARPWLSLRHEGALGGVGTRTWTSGQKARFDRGAPAGARTKNPNVQASMLLEYARERNLVSKAEHDAISLTTLTRYLKSPVFRHALGLTTPRDLEIIVPQAEFDRAAQRFLKDAFKSDPKDPNGVHSRTRKGDREAYADRLRKEGVTPTTRLAASAVPSATAPGAPAATPGGKAGRGRRHPDRRRTVIPYDFSVRVTDPVLRRIYEEGRTLQALDFPFAAAYLLRAFIERTIKLFCKDHRLGHDADVHILAGKAADKLRADGVLNERELKPLRRVASDKHGPLSPDTLGAYVHGGLIPNSTELMRTWDSIQGNLQAMVQRLQS